MTEFTTRLATRADIPAIARIRYDAFNDNPRNATPDELSRLLQSEPDTELGRSPTRDEAIARAESDFNDLFDNGKYDIVGVYADDVLVGAALWQHITPTTPPAAPQTDAKELAAPTLVNRFFARMNRTRESAMQGKSYWFLKLLIIDPEFQRKGLGGMLLKWGTDRADDEGVDAWLESSPMGRALYEKNGFKVLGMDRVDEARAERGYVEWPYMLYESKK